MKRLLPLVLLVMPVSLLAQTGGNAQASNEEKNKALVRRFYEEVWNKGNYDMADELFADGYVRHDPRGGNPPPGARGQKLIAQGFRSDCPDCLMSVDMLLADGDYIVGRWTIRGTHKPSGKKVDFVGVNIFRFANGKVAEIWNHRDDLAFALQTGFVTMAQPTQQPAPKP
jgi:predicted SnoaL-like aldol condensation-catalyzing enzyme